MANFVELCAWVAIELHSGVGGTKHCTFKRPAEQVTKPHGGTFFTGATQRTAKECSASVGWPIACVRQNT